MPKLAAIALASAGIAHVAAIPEHILYTPVHGVAMGAAAAAEIFAGLTLYRNATPARYCFSILLAAGLIALWSITRFLPAPFGHGAEEVEALGVITKLLEATAIALLAAWRMPQKLKSQRTRSLQISWLVLTALLSALTIYGVGVATESSIRGFIATNLAPAVPAHDHGHEANGSPPHEHGTG